MCTLGEMRNYKIKEGFIIGKGIECWECDGYAEFFLRDGGFYCSSCLERLGIKVRVKFGKVKKQDIREMRAKKVKRKGVKDAGNV